jgi:hypothetical protein
MRTPFLVAVLVTPYARKGALLWQGPYPQFSLCPRTKAAVSPEFPDATATTPLTFDALLLELREELQDYVIAHELLHFHAPNHGKLWKSLMRAHLGEYEQLEGELRRVAHDKAMQR